MEVCGYRILVFLSFSNNKSIVCNPFMPYPTVRSTILDVQPKDNGFFQPP